MFDMPEEARNERIGGLGAIGASIASILFLGVSGRHSALH